MGLEWERDARTRTAHANNHTIIIIIIIINQSPRAIRWISCIVKLPLTVTSIDISKPNIAMICHFSYQYFIVCIELCIRLENWMEFAFFSINWKAFKYRFMMIFILFAFTKSTWIYSHELHRYIQTHSLPLRNTFFFSRVSVNNWSVIEILKQITFASSDTADAILVKPILHCIIGVRMSIFKLDYKYLHELFNWTTATITNYI